MNMFSISEDWPSKCHHLQKWFGIKEYIILCHTTDSNRMGISESSLLLSSLSIILPNLMNFTVPILIPIYDKWSGCYVGISYDIENQLLLRFDSDTLSNTPNNCKSIQGIYNYYISKLNNMNSNIHKSCISIQYTFMNPINEWNPHDSLLQLQSEDVNCILWLPVEDPVENMHLSLTSYYSDIKKYWIDANTDNNTPLYRSKYTWRLKCIFTERPYCLLSDCISNILDLISSKSHNYALSNLVVANNSTSSTSSLSVAMDTLSRTFQDIPDAQELDLIIKRVFSEETESEDLAYESKVDAEFIKSAPLNSLLSLFSKYIIKYKNIKAIALLWAEFVKEVRWHWENKVPIPRVSADSQVNLNYSIIYQKLQLINYCTVHSDRKHLQQQKSNEVSEDSGWDFDIEEDSTKTTSEDEKTLIGRLGVAKIIPDMKLIGNNEPMCEPVLQDHGIITEDMILEQQEIFSKLGTSEEAQKLRQRIQAASLLSDVQAFKAANPKSILEDFVRWHSPRDWIPDDDSLKEKCMTGKLSTRMSQPGNLWLSIWEEADPLPASKQKSLFDYTTNAEKALHYLESITAEQLLTQILPVILETIVNNLAITDSCKQIPLLMTSVDSLAKKINDRQWFVKSEKFYNLAMNIKETEALVYRAISLLQHLPGQYSLAESLLASKEAEIKESKQKGLVEKLFTDINGKFPEADSKEYIFRSVLARPFDNSTLCGSRMYVLETANEFRVASVVPTDIQT